jgi:hypothetical protein
MRSALVGADLEHLVDTLRVAPLNRVEAEALAAKRTELLVLRIPARSLLRLADLRDLIAPVTALFAALRASRRDEGRPDISATAAARRDADVGADKDALPAPPVVWQ